METAQFPFSSLGAMLTRAFWAKLGETPGRALQQQGQLCRLGDPWSALADCSGARCAGACGPYGRSTNRMDRRQGAWGAPRGAGLPLRPLPWLSPVPLLLAHSREPDGRREQPSVGREGRLQDVKMRSAAKLCQQSCAPEPGPAGKAR